MEMATLILFLVLGVIIFAYFRRRMSYFSKRGIPHLAPVPILGNLSGPTFRKENFIDLLRRVYDCDHDAKYVGVYNFMEPIIVIRDTELIKSMTIKDFDHFVDHRSFIEPEVDTIFGNNLFALKGDKWRHIRNVLTPAFTTKKIKACFELMTPCAQNFIKYVDHLSESERKEINTKDLFTKYTNDIVAAFAFGIEVDSLNDPNNDFYVIGREATNLQGILSLKLMISRAFPKIISLFNIKMVTDETKQFFMNLVSETVRLRREKNIKRPDMIQMMMDAVDKGDTKLDLLDMTAHAFGFFFGGFDTTSTAMCVLAHLLAIEPEVQKRLQQEIDEVLENRGSEKITYDDVMGMAYMDAVWNESMRRHTQVPVLDRLCTKEYELPPAKPGLKPYVVKPGEMVWFSAAGVHLDPKYYDNPEKFDPDRYMNKKIGMNDVTSLGFGVGPRSCIGNRFAILETKTLLFYVLANYDLIKSSKTCDPLVYSKSTFMLAPEGGFYLGLQKRKKNN